MASQNAPLGQEQDYVVQLTNQLEATRKALHDANERWGCAEYCLKLASFDELACLFPFFGKSSAAELEREVDRLKADILRLRTQYDATLA